MNTKQRQSAMNTKQSARLTVTAATLASLIGFGILWTVVTLFHSRDAPLENTAAAGRACAHYADQSVPEACIRQRLAEAQNGYDLSRRDVAELKVLAFAERRHGTPGVQPRGTLRGM